MDVREKLVELVSDLYGVDPMYFGVDAPAIAKHLADNGVTIQEWIPMTERFPKNGTICLVCTKHGDVSVRLWDVAELFWIGEARGCDLRIDEVTHWMPLPEPPKGE